MMENKHYGDFRVDVENFLKSCKKVYLGPQEKERGIHITLGVTATEDGFQWGYQTGDNSFTGGAYGHPHWITLYLMRKSNCKELSKDAIAQLKELLA